jgi:signal transduction histidine kinase
LGSGEALEGQNMDFLLDVICDNTQIPVILTDDKLQILSALNIDSSQLRHPGYLESELLEMRAQHEPIAIEPAEGIRQFVFYKDSRLLSQLRFYPYLQLGLIVVFLLVSYLAFSLNRRYEQEFLWVGMAKETAHQLGTPISSLLAWHEVLKTRAEESGDPFQSQITTEVGRDLERLKTITERFSRIGSTPNLEKMDLRDSVRRAVDYLDGRIGGNAQIDLIEGSAALPVMLNQALFEWVVENLTKNSVDAMGGQGTLRVVLSKQGRQAVCDVIDTGKGIPATQHLSVFQPGITTRKRGWGLGLALARRIVEKYHKGRIFVHKSEPGKGTNMRILLPLIIEKKTTAPATA